LEKFSIRSSCLYRSPIGEINLTEEHGFLIRADFVVKNSRSDVCLENLEQPISKILSKVCQDLDEYFLGNLKIFKIPLKPRGTFFQQLAWKALLTIPYGETRSYLQQAESIKNPKAVRAIGMANSRNPIPIIIPCHRVIAKNGAMRGYAGGIDRKTYLLEHEHNFMHVQKN